MPCNLFSYIIITTATKWNYFKSKLELKQRKWIYKNTSSPQPSDVKSSSKNG